MNNPVPIIELLRSYHFSGEDSRSKQKVFKGKQDMHSSGLFKVLCTTLSVIGLRLAFHLIWPMKHEGRPTGNFLERTHHS